MADEKKPVCSPFDHPSFLPSWSCCQCTAKGAGTLNSNGRDRCKTCQHERCDNPPTKKIPIPDKGGVYIVEVNTTADKNKAN